MKLENLVVDSYILTPNSKFENENLFLKMTTQSDGTKKWAIYNRTQQSSLNSEILAFTHRPSREDEKATEDYYKENRFDTKEEALEVLKRYLELDYSKHEDYKNESPKFIKNLEIQQQRYKELLSDIF